MTVSPTASAALNSAAARLRTPRGPACGSCRHRTRGRRCCGCCCCCCCCCGGGGGGGGGGGSCLPLLLRLLLRLRLIAAHHAKVSEGHGVVVGVQRVGRFGLESLAVVVCRIVQDETKTQHAALAIENSRLVLSPSACGCGEHLWPRQVVVASSGHSQDCCAAHVLPAIAAQNSWCQLSAQAYHEHGS